MSRPYLGDHEPFLGEPCRYVIPVPALMLDENLLAAQMLVYYLAEKQGVVVNDETWYVDESDYGLALHAEGNYVGALA